MNMLLQSERFMKAKIMMLAKCIPFSGVERRISIAAVLFFIIVWLAGASNDAFGMGGTSFPNPEINKSLNDSSDLSPPVAILHIDPLMDIIPIIWRFDASESYDAEDSSDQLMVRWDFNGDGIWDTEYSTEKVVEGYEYSSTTSGAVTVRLEVRDTDGMTADTIAIIAVPSPYEMIYQTVLESDTSAISILYGRDIRLTLKFVSGNVAGDSLTIIKFVDLLPQDVYSGSQFGNFLSYFSFQTGWKSYCDASLSIEYENSTLNLAWPPKSLDENEFIFAFYDTLESRWKTIPTIADTVNNIVTAEITQLHPLWVLTQKTESLITAVAENKNETTRIVDYHLFQNYPNPFNPSTTIRFDVPEMGNVRIVIYNVLGQQVTELVNENFFPGTYQRIWNASRFGAGIYFVRMEAPDFVRTQKVTLLK